MNSARKQTALLALIWLGSGFLAIHYALLWLPAAIVDGVAIPTGHDAFYHARRILDFATGARDFYEFDNKIHVPEGSWITWSWGYDYFMALLARWLHEITGISHMRILVQFPPLFTFIAAALLLLSVRLLNLRLSFIFIVGLCFGFSPLTQSLHGAGQIYHHFVEHTVVLASLAVGLLFFALPTDSKSAALAGLVLGVAPVFHTALFLLQLPLIATYFILWLRDALPGRRASNVLCIALAVGLLFALMNSAAFQRGVFSYKFLSVFQLYAGFLTCLAIQVFHRVPPRMANVVLFTVMVTVAALPLVGNILDGMRFVGRDFVELANMPEAASYFSLGAIVGAPTKLTRTYGALVWLLPLVVLGCVTTVCKSNNRQLIYYAFFALFGITLLTQQYRFHHFGSFAIVTAPLLWLDRQAWLPNKSTVNAVIIAVFVATFIPCLP